ncbi:uncharacterized protein PGTG_18519 [Puccinia graminis f. sp. tritici CRL 75-36-700-3]|uniref:Uncharacterized protein n=1 Tax=Puccinia graminis f. sp. tritici (strain CRL 75-36-700-3 / race SCCL) TaxID=418459 RepID=E3L7J6_PUCGT|nr:uncharacterized protein PGTG_18519 [Puccinia graminis f. sp. tritici CRL 75-36-700-3]EFP92521.2 hypothetical protein PGTG_18519 [Puccinia graminis f. sp. tritici CRL 75-36-700-3]
MGSQIRIHSLKWAILTTTFLIYNISSVVSNRFDASRSLLAEQRDSDPAIWDKKDGYSALKEIQIPQDRRRLELKSSAEGGVPLQVYRRKRIKPDSPSVDQIGDPKFAKASSSSTTKEKSQGPGNTLRTLKLLSDLSINDQSAKSSMLPTHAMLSTQKRVLRETVSNAEGSERRTIGRWAPSRYPLEAPGKRVGKVYHPEMFDPVAKDSVFRFEMEEEKTAQVLRRGLNELEKVLLQKLPWKANTTTKGLGQRFVQIEYLLTFMMEGPLYQPKSIKFRKIRAKAFAHYDSQIKVLDMLKQTVGLMGGIQDSIAKLKESTELPELMNTLEILELIRHGAVIPVSQRLETELKDIIVNSEDYLDLEFATSEEDAHHPHVGSEEPEAILQAETLLTSVKEALQLNRMPEQKRAIAQIPDSTDDFLDTLRNLKKCQVDLQQLTSSTKSTDLFDLLEHGLKELRRNFDDNSPTSNWAARLVKQGMSDEQRNLDVILQDMLVSDVLAKFLHKIVVQNEHNLDLSSYEIKNKPRKYHDLTLLMIEKLQNVDSQIAKKQSSGLNQFFNTDVMDAMATYDIEPTHASDYLQEFLEHLSTMLHNGHVDQNSQMEGWLQNMSKYFEEILGYTQVQLTHQKAIAHIESQLQIIQHSIVRYKNSDEFLSTALSHQIQGWLREIGWMRFSFLNNQKSSTLHTAGKSDKTSMEIRFESQAERLVKQIKEFHQKLESLIYRDSHPSKDMNGPSGH